uniref:Phosphate transporter PHO1-2 isoform X2 n=1 Tax=Elaeis guineensis var. tenera TaxID=51953 RepID=A0A6I9SA39_ELAGV|nr:phosphate transporter PHO1-2 isoform X2 [Elaeis guineensis]
MVKFSRELEAELIPEWKDAFVNYRQLKKHVKKIKLGLLRSSPSHSDGGDAVAHPYCGFSLLSPLRALASRFSALRNQHLQTDEENLYEMELVRSREDEVKEFLEKLDEELDKVENFHQIKENEFCERGEILRKQLQILVDLRQIILHDRRRLRHRSSSSPASPTSTTSGACPRLISLSSFSESEAETDPAPPSSGDSPVAGEVIAALERNGVNFVGSARTKAKKGGKPRAAAMRIDIPATTPGRTISAVTSSIWEDLVNSARKDGSGGGDQINRKKIQCAEKMIRVAFVELYRGLGLLRTYSSLNMMAFSKILKKFDKVTNQKEASEWFLKKVKRSHFVSSDKMVKLADEVETIFIEHFASNDKKKAMKFLKPHKPNDSHMITFFVGLFTGSFVTLFSVYAILAHSCGIFSSTTEPGYVETIYPIFSTFALLSLHIFLYGCNIFMWRSTRINHNFIFEFNPSSALKHRDAFLICTSFMTTVVGAMVIHLLLRSAGVSLQHVKSIPAVLLLLFLGLLVFPFDIFYRPTRYCFLRVIRNIMFSPFYKVLMVDFFMADQLTSQIPLLRHMEFTACYFMAGGFRTHPYETCTRSHQYKLLAYVISFLPYYWRAMQALNFVLRLAWVESVMRLNLGQVENRLADFLLASVEIIRRGHWNFYRLENEHLNNVGKFRAVKTVPLPFRELDSDG